MHDKTFSNLRKELKKIRYDKRVYFEWKFDIRYKRDNEPMTKEKFLKLANRSTMDPYFEWEKTEEYRKLVALYLRSLYSNDLIEIYNAVCEKAKKGESKAIDTMLKLQKEINSIIKNTNVEQKQDEQDEDDELEL